MNQDEHAEELYAITKKQTAAKWDEKEKNVEILGKLGDLYETLIRETNESEEDETVHYTDIWSKSMDIVVGKPVQKDRKECDADYRIECSNGLHVGATKYVESFHTHLKNDEIAILACYVNPMNVVAVPLEDHSKIRVSEYFPFAVATYENGRIDIVEQTYFEDDYVSIEEEDLNKLLEKIKNEESPIETAENAEEDTRSAEEIQKILESRLIDIMFV